MTDPSTHQARRAASLAGIKQQEEAVKPREFAQYMQHEIDSNGHKGEWDTWKPDAPEILQELTHHALKLQRAIYGFDPIGVTEHAADTANLCMKIAELFGETETVRRPDDQGAELDRSIDAAGIRAARWRRP